MQLTRQAGQAGESVFERVAKLSRGNRREGFGSWPMSLVPQVGHASPAFISPLQCIRFGSLGFTVMQRQGTNPTMSTFAIEFPRTRLPERFCNLERLLHAMRARGVDGVVASTANARNERTSSIQVGCATTLRRSSRFR